MEEWLKNVPGAQALFDWFGYWPSFHDAEVLSVHLNRTGTSTVQAHTWEMTDKVDARGFFVCRKHCVVTFEVEELAGMDLAHFNNQNALSNLDFYKKDSEFVLDFAPAHGLQGTVRAKKVSIQLTPGIPSDSQYKEQED
jgi:hypothetical protein